VDYLYDLTADEAAESCSGEVLEGNVCESLGEVVGMCHAEEGTPTPLAAYLFSSDYDATTAEAWCTDGGGRFEAP
jgi:hypothetical protein